MKKLHPIKDQFLDYPEKSEIYDDQKSWIVRDKFAESHTDSNMYCDKCGSWDFHVCWWDYDFTGGYCRIICSKCGNDLVLINDYA